MLSVMTAITLIAANVDNQTTQLLTAQVFYKTLKNILYTVSNTIITRPLDPLDQETKPLDQETATPLDQETPSLLYQLILRLTDP